MKFKLSINKNLKNKDNPTKPGWENAEFSTDMLMEHIRKGFAFSQGVLKSSATDKKPAEKDIECAYLLPIDIDNTIKDFNPNIKRYDEKIKTIEEGYLPLDIAMADPWLHDNALLIYTTPSHTEEHHRFRIVFLLPEPIYDAEQYKKIATAFINKFQADQSCKNIDRLFFGSENAEYLIFDKQLNKRILNKILVDPTKEENKIKKFERQMPATLSADQVKEMLSYIPKRMAYDEWGKIVSAIGNTFDEHTAISLIDSWSPDEKVGTAYRVKHRSPKPTIASVVYYAKQHGYDTSKLFNSFSSVEVNSKGELVDSSANVKKYPLTEVGNAERFADQYENQIKFNHTSGKWHVWNGHKWQQDELNSMISLGIATVRLIKKEASKLGKNKGNPALVKYAKELMAHAKKSETKAQLNAMISLASSDPRIACTNDDFDKNVYLFNLQNGTYDLLNNTFKPHDPKDMLTKCADVNYVEKYFDNINLHDTVSLANNIDCISFELALHTMFMQSQEYNIGLDTVRFVQKALGLSLCGAHLEEALFFCYGSGKNGKSVFFNVIKMIFGDYFQKAPTEMLLLKNNDSIPNDVARLPGARLVVAEELPDNRSFDENKIKNLTGGDQITARFMFKDYFDFKPTHTLWLYGNHKPRIKGTDEGIWRRMHLIPFTNTIPKDELRPQVELMEEFTEEKDAIFAWILVGWKLYRKEGLKPPEIILNATKEYREEEDRLADFFLECCEFTSTSKIKASELLKDYHSWCDNNKETPLSKNKFYKAVASKDGVKMIAGHGNNRYFSGIISYINKDNSKPFF